MLLIASTSGYFGKKWSDDARALKGSVAKMTKEANDAKSSLQLLEEALKPDAKTLPLDHAVSATLLEIFNKRVAHGISVTSITPGKRAGGMDKGQLTGLAEDVPGTTLKSVKVNVDGTYRTYPGLMDYLANLQSGQVAVTRLKVQDQAFEMSLRVYGGLEQK